MKLATTIADNGAFSVQKSIFEFALRAQKITILGALATQFHEISGLAICHLPDLVSKVSSAAVNDMRAATSSNFAKKSLSVSQWIHLAVFSLFFLVSPRISQTSLRSFF
jgi:hypothetical protein